MEHGIPVLCRSSTANLYAPQLICWKHAQGGGIAGRSQRPDRFSTWRGGIQCVPAMYSFSFARGHRNVSYNGWAGVTSGFSRATEIARMRMLSFFGRINVVAFNGSSIE